MPGPRLTGGGGSLVVCCTEYMEQLKDLGRVAPSRSTHMEWEDAPAFAKSRGSRLLTALSAYQPGDVVLFSQFVMHGAFDANSQAGRARLSTDVRWVGKVSSPSLCVAALCTLRGAAGAVHTGRCFHTGRCCRCCRC